MPVNIPLILKNSNTIFIESYIVLNMRRAVVTGMGAVTPLANNLQDSWLSILNNESGIGQYLND